jgi:hydrogenase expression/formation protein HypE
VKSRSDESSVTSALGDGGAAMHRFLTDDILPRFSNFALSALEDGAAVTLNGVDIIVSTDGFTVTPAIFPGGDIGKLSITGTVNDILASGGRALYMTFGLVVSEGFPIETLRRILDSVEATAREAGVAIVAGDTKVIPSGTAPEILINTAGIGMLLDRNRQYRVSEACPGDRIIVTGTIGDHGLAVLSAREGLGFEQRIKSDCAALHDLLGPLLEEFPGIHTLRDPTRGGLAGALLDIAEGSGVEVVICEDAVPVRHEVKFGCEMLGVNPLFLVNEGKMVVVVDSKVAESVLDKLRAHPLGASSNIIGTVRETSSTGWLISKSEVSERLIVRPEGEPLPRMC